MDEGQSMIITEGESVTISQTTDTSKGQEIQTVILSLKEAEEIVEFN